MLLIVVHYALHQHSESAPLFFSQLAGSAKAEQTTRDIVDSQFKAPAPHGQCLRNIQNVSNIPLNEFFYLLVCREFIQGELKMFLCFRKIVKQTQNERTEELQKRANDKL